MPRLLLLLLLVPGFALAQIPTEVKLAQGTFHEYLEPIIILKQVR